MTPALVPLLMIGLFVVVIGLAVRAGIRQGKRARDNVCELAESLGLQMAETPPTLGVFYTDLRAGGTRRGRRVEVFAYATGSGKSRTQWCAVSAAAPGAGGLTFHLQRQGFATKLVGMFGVKEITVGDAEFDRAWFIQTNQPDSFGAALLPELREKITALVQEPGSPARGLQFKLEQGVVRYSEMGNFADTHRCQRCLRAADIVCDLADAAEVVAGQQPSR